MLTRHHIGSLEPALQVLRNMGCFRFKLLFYIYHARSVISVQKKIIVVDYSLLLSMRLPSSSCSATVKSGNFAGMMRRGVTPGTTLYFEKSETSQ